MISMPSLPVQRATPETYSSLFSRFLKFGLLAFGGPVAQISMMQEELVEREQWMDAGKFAKVLAVYQMLPGPEATELAAHMGYLRKGRMGALLAGLGFVLPGFLLMLALSWLYFTYGTTFRGAQLFLYGMKPAVMAMIILAVYRISMASIKTRLHLAIAAVSLFLSLFTSVNFIVIIFGLGFLALALGKKALPTVVFSLGSLNIPIISNKLALVFLVGLEAGLLTFGGAYTAIPFLEQGAVREYGWLTHPQFVDGIGLGGMIPAPLVIIATFMGYGAAGLWGALLATLGIFLPAFAFTIFGYNHILRILDNQRLQYFLGAVTASVIGLIGSSSIILFPTTVIDIKTSLFFVFSLYLLYTKRLSVPLLIASSSLAGALALI